MTISANGFKCTEYILPSRTKIDPDVLECFIPVSNGDQLTVTGHFSGSILHGAFDLLADGSFLRDTRHEGSKTGKIRWLNRKIKFQEVLDTPIPEGWTSIYMPKKVVEGNLHVKQLVNPPQPGVGDDLGVGSLTIIVSVNQKSRDNHQHNYADITCGNWRARDPKKAAEGGVASTHELALRVTDGDININRMSKHRRHFEQTRFGPKPWAKFIFYYRTPMAIQAAGCITRPNESQALQPNEERDFMRCEQLGRRASSKRAQKEAVQEDEDEIVVAGMQGSPKPSNASPTHGNSMFMTPPPAELKKQKLFGQSFAGRADPAHLAAICPTSGTETIAPTTEGQPNAQPEDVTASELNTGEHEIKIKEESVSPGPESSTISDTADGAESQINPPFFSLDTAVRAEGRFTNHRIERGHGGPMRTYQDQAQSSTPKSSDALPETSPLMSMAKSSLSNIRASSASLSREDTPSKMRMTPSRARKEELLASLRKKRQLKDEAETALQDARKRQKEAERERDEGETREIEMLEKMNAEEEEELAVFTRAREQVEAALEEIRQEREEFDDMVKKVGHDEAAPSP